MSGGMTNHCSGGQRGWQKERVLPTTLSLHPVSPLCLAPPLSGKEKRIGIWEIVPGMAGRQRVVDVCVWDWEKNTHTHTHIHKQTNNISRKSRDNLRNMFVHVLLFFRVCACFCSVPLSSHLAPHFSPLPVPPLPSCAPWSPLCTHRFQIASAIETDEARGLWTWNIDFENLPSGHKWWLALVCQALGFFSSREKPMHWCVSTCQPRRWAKMTLNRR